MWLDDEIINSAAPATTAPNLTSALRAVVHRPQPLHDEPGHVRGHPACASITSRTSHVGSTVIDRIVTRTGTLVAADPAA
jgi:hypothetical protein